MIQSLKDLKLILDRSSFAGKEAIELRILDSSELAYVIPIEVSTLLEDWTEAKELLAKSHLRPIVTTLWSGCDDFADSLRKEDLFSRFYYDEAPSNADVSPHAILKRSEKVDVEKFLQVLSNSHDTEMQDYFQEVVDFLLDCTRQRYGISPRKEDIDFGDVNTEHKLERWLLDWELENGFGSDDDDFHLEWFMPDNACIVFLPVEYSWEALAYLNWFGTSDYGSEYYIALGKVWEEKYGAELAMHYGTMLQCLVSRPPMDIESSWGLARQHLLVGSCTASSDTLRDYARSIVGYNRWFLHERP